MLYSTQNLHEIRQAINIADYVGRIVPLRPSGVQLKGRCPFHDEKTPSFYVHPDKKFYICYGCGAKGDLFDFVMRYDGISFGDAVRKLALEAGITLETAEPEKEEGLRKEQEYKKHLFHINSFVTDFFAHKLEIPAGAIARNYLESRKITMETARRFRIGYAMDSWDSLTIELSSRGMIKGALELGLIKPGTSGNYYDFFRHRLMFPVLDTSGRVCGFSGRILDSERKEGKYVNSPESSVFLKRKSLFGINLARPAILREKSVPVLVEGNLDVVSCHQAGISSAIAPLGTAFTDEQLALIRRFSKELHIMFDGDIAGKSAALKTIPLLVSREMSGHTVLLPEKEDPDSIIRNHGRDYLVDIISKARPHIETYLDITLPGREKPVSERVASLNNLEPLWKILPENLRDVYVEHISILLDVDIKAVKSYLKRINVTGPEKNIIPKTEKLAIKTLNMEERSELTALMHLFALYFKDTENKLPSLEKSGMEEMFAGNLAKDLLRTFMENGPGIEADMGSFLGDYLMAEFKSAKDSFKDNIDLEGVFAEIMNKITVLSLRHRIKLLDFQIMDAKKEGDNNKLHGLLNEKLNLERLRIKQNNS
ncbi:MAG: DNA primase [Deltaproteobacteria bacterium]|nr:DNA primase [Deltaproteobacteria bacterium]